MNEFKEETILEFREVTAGYENRIVLDKVSFKISKGEFLYLIGRTGVGKSSILKSIYADLKPLSGHIKVGGHIIETIKAKEIPYLRRKLGIVFQDFQLLPDRNVYENLAFVMRATGWRDKKKMRIRISELLMRVGLSAKARAIPHQLSGGEQQRVTIARALVNDPLLLIADEPTGNLDPDATEKIMEILFKINLAGTAILMATHEHGLLERYPARVLELREQKIIDHRYEYEHTKWSD